MHELVRCHPRFGYRRIWAMFRLEGAAVNRKRIHRLWKQEHLKVPIKQHKKSHIGSSENSVIRRQAEYKDHVWCWDFIHDSDERGRPLKWFAIVDEFTRECLVLEVQRSIRSVDVIDLLAELFLIRGLPKHIRSDNGPEFISNAIKRYLLRAKIETFYIERGSPWQNGYAESFNSKLRDELLNAQVFIDVRDAGAHAARWQNEYNHRRPHSSLGYVPPATFAAALENNKRIEQIESSLGCPPVGASPLPPDSPASTGYNPQTLIEVGT